MFSILKSRSQERDIIGKLSLLPLQFTIEQKSAVVVSLVKLAKEDGVIPAKRFNYLDRLLELLNPTENSWIFKGVYDAGPESSLTMLRKLWDNQKEWYVIMLYGLIGQNRDQMLQVCKEIDVSQQQYQNIVSHL